MAFDYKKEYRELATTNKDALYETKILFHNSLIISGYKSSKLSYKRI